MIGQCKKVLLLPFSLPHVTFSSFLCSSCDSYLFPSLHIKPDFNHSSLLEKIVLKFWAFNICNRFLWKTWVIYLLLSSLPWNLPLYCIPTQNISKPYQWVVSTASWIIHPDTLVFSTCKVLLETTNKCKKVSIQPPMPGTCPIFMHPSSFLEQRILPPYKEGTKSARSYAATGTRYLTPVTRNSDTSKKLCYALKPTIVLTLD